METFNDICGVNQFSDFWKILKERGDLIPNVALGSAHEWVFGSLHFLKIGPVPAGILFVLLPCI